MAHWCGTLGSSMMRKWLVASRTIAVCLILVSGFCNNFWVLFYMRLFANLGYYGATTTCIDHRGTPEHPARTCTLEYKEGGVCVSYITIFSRYRIHCWLYIIDYRVVILFPLLRSFQMKAYQAPSANLISWCFFQWGAVYCVRGGEEKERLAMAVCRPLKALQLVKQTCQNV